MLLDGYKIDHRRQYASGTEYVASNLTPRTSRVPEAEGVTFFGLQYYIKEYVINDWNENFFKRSKRYVVDKYYRRIKGYLSPEHAEVIGTEHLEDLHDLGYLPIDILALPEGVKVPIGVPPVVFINTHEDFAWLTNSFETIFSTTIWLGCTSATTAKIYRKILDDACRETNPEAMEFVPFQGHDFSMRGMPGLEAAKISGAAHLLSFVGTDTVPAIDFLETYYNADADRELVGCSVPATEHAVSTSLIANMKHHPDFEKVKAMLFTNMA